MGNRLTRLFGDLAAALAGMIDGQSTDEYTVGAVTIHPPGHEHLATLLLTTTRKPPPDDENWPVEFHIDWVNWPALMTIVEELKPGDTIDLVTRSENSYFASGTEVLSIIKNPPASPNHAPSPA